MSRIIDRFIFFQSKVIIEQNICTSQINICFKGSILKVFAYFGIRINAQLVETFQILLLDTVSMQEPNLVTLHYVTLFLLMLWRSVLFPPNILEGTNNVVTKFFEHTTCESNCAINWLSDEIRIPKIIKKMQVQYYGEILFHRHLRTAKFMRNKNSSW